MINVYEHSYSDYRTLDTGMTYYSVREALAVEGVEYVSIPRTCTGYGATAVERSNDATIGQNFPGVIPSAWNRDALAPVALLLDDDGDLTELACVIELLTDYPVYDDSDYLALVEEEILDYLASEDASVSADQWLDAAHATGWSYWPYPDGDYYYLDGDDYETLRAAVVEAD